MSVLHFSHASNGGAGRAGRRAHLACQAAGIESNFAFVQGEPPDGDEFQVNVAAGPDAGSAKLAEVLTTRIQWGDLIARRTALTNTLLSIPYPGVDLDHHRLFDTAEIIHLHWPTYAVTPRQLANWLEAGRVVFWTLHDFNAMTGGCHYPAGCVQYQTSCMKCPQLFDDPGFVPNSFAEKQRMYADGGALFIITPSRWLAECAGRSAILGGRPITVVPNPIELDVFRPPADRNALRTGIGIGEDDFVLLVGSYDASEKRKGFTILRDALQELLASGALADCLPSGATIHIALIGKSIAAQRFPNCKILSFGNVDDDEAMADILGLADLIAVPSIEDNYPNVILEGMSCGTPSLGFAAGGVPEMIRDGVTGVLAPNVGSMEALKNGILRFAREHFGDTAMRRACRAAAEATNHPQAIGRRLRQLYETALGRPLRGGSTDMHRRIARTLAKAEMLPDLRLGTDLAQFPVNYTLRSRGASDSAAARVVAVEEPKPRPGTRLITVRTRHEHHSSRSGPYQFLRHLPQGAYDLSHLTVPLGSELAGPAASLYQRAGSFLGTGAFAHANNWLAEAELASRCIARSVDLVHFIDGEHGGWLLPSLPDAVFGAAGKPRFVITLHQPPAGLEPLVNHGLLGRHDAIVVLCRAQKEYLGNHVDPARVFVVPHGVDTDFFHPSPPEAEPDRPSDRFRLLLVGHWLRDLDSVFAALDLLPEAGVAADLTIVSPVQVNRSANAAVTVLSDLSDEALREAYWSTDALLLPLLDATANNAILEAMACGKPVISTYVGGVPEMVGSDAALLCPPRDPRALADAVIRLATRPSERANMAKAARRRAEELDWRAVGQLHHAVYEAVLRARTPGC